MGATWSLEEGGGVRWLAVVIVVIVVVVVVVVSRGIAQIIPVL